MPIFKKKSEKNLSRSSRSRDRLRSGGAPTASGPAAAPAGDSRANEVFPTAQPSQYTGHVAVPRPPQHVQRPPAATAVHQPPQPFQQQQMSLVPIADVQVQRQRMAAPSPAHLAQLTPMVPPPMSSPMPMSAAAMQHHQHHQQGGQHHHSHPAPYAPTAPPPAPSMDSTAYVAVGPTLVPVGDTPPRSSRASNSTGMPLNLAPAPAPLQTRYDQYEQAYPSGYEQQQGIDYMEAKAPPTHREDDGEDFRGTVDGKVLDSADYYEDNDEEYIGEGSDTEDEEVDDDDEDDDFILPSVAEAADDVWRNDADDFIGAAEALRVLHQAIAAAAEDENDEDRDGDDGEDVDGGSNGLGSEMRRRLRQEEQRDVYDPSDIFLCIQGAALRYHATWVTRVEERQIRASKMTSTKETSSNDAVPNIDDVDAEEIAENSADEATVKIEEKAPKERGEDEVSAAQGSELSEDNVVESFENNLAAQGEQKEEEIAVAATMEEVVNDGGDSDSRSSDENLEEEEQAAWDVWEEAIGAAAALATTCVGPAWQSQIRRRRRWLANGRTDLIPRRSTSMMSDQQDDGMSVSTVGMGSVAGAAWQAQEQAHMAQFLGHNFRQSLGGTPELEEVTDHSLGSNPQAGGRLVTQGDEGISTPGASSAGGRGDGSFSPWNHPIVPEVLPAAMLRFAASVSEMAVPPLRTSDSTIRVEGAQSHLESESKNPKSENEDGQSLESRPVDEVVGRAVWEAQRWLVRRQRVGNAQRDLVLALCCEPSDEDGDNSSQVTGRGTGNGQQRSPANSVVSGISNYRNGEGPQWTIVGAHIPVASMLATWIETAKAGWPTQRSSFDPTSVDVSGPKDLAWSRVAKAGAIDWWYVLQVSRASTDLVTAGWRPPPRGSAGENCIKGLLDIARRGLVLSSRDFKSSRRSFDQDAREERLAAASSSAEALSTLANIGSRGFLPLPTVGIVAKGLCSLLASIDPTMTNISVSSLYPLPNTRDEDENVALTMEKEAFFSQRESCVADIAELLWSLLAHGASTCPAIEALLKFIEMHALTSAEFPGLAETTSPSSATLTSSTASATATETTFSVSTSVTASATTATKSFGSKRGDKKSILAAAGAIRACGAAFWGDPPQVKGVGSLRIFWNQLLLLLARISSSIRCPRDFHDAGISGQDKEERLHSSTQLEPVKSGGITVDTKAIKHGLGHHTLCLCEQTQPSLVVILEVAVALRRLTDGELIQHIDTLAPDEWEPFLGALETLVEWLDARLIFDHPKKCRAVTKRNKMLLRRIIAEVRAIFDQTEAFLTRGGIDGNFHCIVDDEYRKKLHTLLLRTACPLLQPTHATNVALSVVRSWTWGGYYLNRGDLWYKIASNVLGDAFSMFDQESFGFRGYVHAPSVRREALRAVSKRYGDINDSQINKQRTPSRGSSRRGAADEKNYSQAALATKVHEMQVERICPFFLPYLHEILLPSTYSDLLKNPSRVVIEVPSSLKIFASQMDEPIAPTGIGAQVMELESEKYDDTSDEDRTLVEKTIVDEFCLRKSAVRMLGRLLRILTSDRRIRQTIIAILRDVAKSFCTFQTADFPALADLSPLFLKGTAKILMAQELFCLSLEAIRQLGDSLVTPFDARPLTHWICGEILGALSTIVQYVHSWPHTVCSDPMTNLPIDASSRKVLVLSALLPMARIRISHDTRAMIIKEALVRKYISANILSVIDKKLATEQIVVSDEDQQEEEGDALPAFFDEYKQSESARSEIAPFVFVRMPIAKTKETDIGENVGDSSALEKTEMLPRTGAIISLDDILSSIEKLLVSESHTDANISSSDAPHRSLIIDVGTEEIDAAIRALSCRTLCELMLCGLPVQFTLQIPPLASLDEVEARNKAISSFACFVVHNDSPENRYTYAKICADEIFSLFNNYNFVGPPDGCRGTLSLLAAALSVDDFSDGDGPSSSGIRTRDEETLWAGLCNRLVDRLHSFLDDQSAPYGVTNQRNDPSVPLLSTIYDIFTLSRTTKFVPPESVRLRTVLVCLRLCSKSQSCQWISLQGKVLALQCAGSVIRIMKDNEAQMVLNESMWDMHPGEVSGINEDCFESLIVDLLVRRYLASRHVDNSNQEGSSAKKRQLTAEFTSHESLAKETIDIENFPVEKDNRATAAWLCGDTLLMCRLGDFKSRHRGWIEVTVRSPTCRLRRLVRLPLCNSIAQPDFPSSLWSLTRSLNKSYQAPSSSVITDTSNEEEGILADGTEVEGTLKGFPSDNSEKQCTKIENDSGVERETSLRYNLEALDKAKAVIRRFEATPNIVQKSAVLESKYAEEDGTKRVTRTSEPKNESQTSVDATDDKLDVVSMRKELEKMKSEMDDMIVTGRIRAAEDKRPEHKRSYSADNLPSDLAVGDITPLSKGEFTADADSMTAHSWLRSILGRSTRNIERVEDELRSLGFSESMIGSTSPDDDDHLPTAVIHRVFERWQRLQSGPKLARAVGLLDRTACSLQTHKIALLFAGPGSIDPKDDANGRTKSTNDESILLRATNGSPEFIEFSRGLGAMVMTRHLKYFSGGLDTSAYLADGSFALAYVGDDDDCQGFDGSVTAKTMVLFHSVPLMPPGVNNRKRHVGNDVVHIIFAEKDNEAVDGFGRNGNNYDYEEDVNDRNADVSGEFGFVWIIVSPSAGVDLMRVTIKAKADLDDETHAAVSHLLGTSLFPKDIAARCVRQLAIRADIACRSTKSMQDRLGLVSNYEERLHQIKKLSRHALQR